MFSRSLLVKPSSSMQTPAWSVIVMLLLVGFVSNGPVPSLDVNNGRQHQHVDNKPAATDRNSTGMFEDQYVDNTTHIDSENTGLSVDLNDGNGTRINGNYTKLSEDSEGPDFLTTPGVTWPTFRVHPNPPSGDQIAGMKTIDDYGNGKR